MNKEINLESKTLRNGIGCFETIKVLPPTNALFLEEHIERLLLAIDICKIKLDLGFDEIKEKVNNFLKNKKFNSIQVLRLIITQEQGLYIFCEDYIDNMPKSLKLKLGNKWKIESTNPLNKIKSFNYLKNHLAYEEALSEGFDDYIFINEKNEIVETTKANIFFLNKNNKWLTPSLESGCLAGIIRKKLIKELNAEEITIKENNLKDFIGGLITNSLIESKKIKSISIENKESYSFKTKDSGVELSSDSESKSIVFKTSTLKSGTISP